MKLFELLPLFESEDISVVFQFQRADIDEEYDKLEYEGWALHTPFWLVNYEVTGIRLIDGKINIFISEGLEVQNDKQTSN